MTTTFIEANNVNTSLASAASSSATTLTLASSVGLPTLTGGQQMALTLNDAATGSIYEVTYVTAITGGTLTVLRGQEGTTAQNWNVGDFAFCAPTEGTVAQINGNPAQQFQVAPSTAANQAPQTGQLQTGSVSYAVATGTANAHTIALAPALTARTDGMLLRYKAPAANTSAVTLTDGVGTVAVIGSGHAPLQGGEYIANGDALVVWNSTINSGTYILLECTGGALQVSPATQSGHAVQQIQAAGVVGSVRNLVMSVATASASATLTADEIIVESALGGTRWCLPSFNKTINLATTGAGGMDTGTAPVSGFVAIYAIYNSTSGVSALLATNATSAVVPNVYGGANMPSGFTANALVSVWSTNGSGQFVVGLQTDRSIMVGSTNVISAIAFVTSMTAVVLSNVPLNARSISGIATIGNNSANNSVNFALLPEAGLGGALFGLTSSAVTTQATAYSGFPLVPGTRTVYYTITGTTAPIAVTLVVNGYTF